MTTFLDTNVLIFLLDESSQYHEWAVKELEECRARGPAIISDIVYCEFSVAMDSLEKTNTAIGQFSLEQIRGSNDALFRAGKAFLAYKRNGGARNRILPDFIIGAIAAVTGAPLITANPADFANYFPEMEIISPQVEVGAAEPAS